MCESIDLININISDKLPVFKPAILFLLLFGFVLSSYSGHLEYAIWPGLLLCSDNLREAERVWKESEVRARTGVTASYTLLAGL